RGELSVERQRKQWSVVTVDGKKTLAVTGNEEEARAVRDGYQELIDLGRTGGFGALEAHVKPRGDLWTVRSTDGRRVLATCPFAETARDQLCQLLCIGRDQAAQQRSVWIALLVGFDLGGLGTFAVWRRSRRTPEVLAQTGIARTFQNIRLFGNLSVIDNVL